jgi:hypothetical protein
MTTTITTREALHNLIDRLPDAALQAAGAALEPVLAEHDPVLRAFLNAPIDDEPLTEEDIAAIEAAKARVRRGEYVTFADLERRLDEQD